ncbi:hypothetical protein Cni_G09904 [Canna indica]|uniref:Glycosyltransferase 61 catalytic domain-containing protein n=1 Tax=Canna indica TaxID=4628 RepID=A0AAQ3K578_9LILI|nr:hypothetical protein Cni_G09904 [Canna indica]
MQKMGYEVMLAKSLNRMESRKLGLALLVGFSIGVFTCFISMTVSTDKPQSSRYENYADPAAESSNSLNNSDDGVVRMKQIPSPWMQYNSSSTGQVKDSAAKLVREKETGKLHGKDADEVVQRKASLTPKNQIIESKETDGTIQAKPVCDLSNPRTDVCDVEGDVRVHAKSSSVILVTNHQFSREKNSWRIKPYARKFDGGAMKNIREVSVRLMSNGSSSIPSCAVKHGVLAIIFTLGGYTGNYYHTFTDVLVPLFITAHQFAGEVQFLMETKNLLWISKYEPILKKLSSREIIFFNDDGDDEVHCFPRVIVGLHSHKPMSIDPVRAPNGYSMVDFTRLMRAAYGLERNAPVRLGGGGEVEEKKKPRLLLISRQGTRRFTNTEEIMRTAEEAEFEVVVAEPKKGSEVANVARVVNSCDVMVGVHGAGLTNLVFLPTGAVIIQIVPWGKLENISRSCFGYSSEDAGLRYLEYSICEEESTLIEMYPREDAVFRDPKSIHRMGWMKMGEVYMNKQNVKLDVKRFKPLLLKARQLLHQ